MAENEDIQVLNRTDGAPSFSDLKSGVRSGGRPMVRTIQ